MKKIIALLLIAATSLTSTAAFAAPGRPGGNGNNKPGQETVVVNGKKVMFFISRWGVQWDSKGNVETRDTSHFSGKVGDANLNQKLNKNFNVVIGGSVTEDDLISYLTSTPDESTIFNALEKEYKKQGAVLYTSSGNQVTWENFTSDNYEIQWYVLKRETDGWHVDGFIVEKETQDKVDIVLPEEKEDYEDIIVDGSDKNEDDGDIKDENDKEDVVPPAIPDSSIQISGANYAYIFGYEPLIIPVTDEEGNTTYTAEITMGMDDDVTVEQVSSMLIRILDQNGNTADMTFPMTDNVRPHQGQWYERGLLYLCSVGGFDEDETIRTVAISRGQVAKLVACALNLNLTEDAPFVDVADSEYKEYIDKVYAYGYMNGLGDGTFAPEKTMTRAEFCSLFNNILNRDALGLTALDSEGNPYEITAEDYYFIDMNPSHWAYEICLKATSAYDSEGYVDIITRNSNIRNIIDQYDSQKIF